MITVAMHCDSDSAAAAAAGDDVTQSWIARTQSLKLKSSVITSCSAPSLEFACRHPPASDLRVESESARSGDSEVAGELEILESDSDLESPVSESRVTVMVMPAGRRRDGGRCCDRHRDESR